MGICVFGWGFGLAAPVGTKPSQGFFPTPPLPTRPRHRHARSSGPVLVRRLKRPNRRTRRRRARRAGRLTSSPAGGRTSASAQLHSVRIEAADYGCTLWPYAAWVKRRHDRHDADLHHLSPSPSSSFAEPLMELLSWTNDFATRRRGDVISRDRTCPRRARRAAGSRVPKGTRAAEGTSSPLRWASRPGGPNRRACRQGALGPG